jgi:hypothetical protein
MSTAALQHASWPAAHRQFTTVLPRIEKAIRFQFRHMPYHLRDEAIADAQSAVWHAWYGLLARGRDPMMIRPTGFAFNAARYVKAGRRLGTGSRGGAVMDVYRRRASGTKLELVSLDCPAGEAGEDWRAWLTVDPRWTPANEVAFRIDFAEWLERLPAHKRCIAELLSEGHGTGEVARRVGVTPAAISQTRVWLENSWNRYQAGSNAVP